MARGTKSRETIPCRISGIADKDYAAFVGDFDALTTGIRTVDGFPPPHGAKVLSYHVLSLVRDSRSLAVSRAERDDACNSSYARWNGAVFS